MKPSLQTALRLFTVLLALAIALGRAEAAAPWPFFVFDNGLRGEKLRTIEAQLDLVKSVGFDGLSWRTDAPARVRQVLAGAAQRGLSVHVVYVNLELRDGKLVQDPRLPEIIAACQGTGAMIWPNITSKQFKPSDPAGDAIAVTGLRELADTCAAHGLRVALYPHVNMWLHRTEDALRLVRQVNRPNVGVTFNLCHALMDNAEDRIPALLEAAAPHLYVVTINGAEGRPAKPDAANAIKLLGQGSYDVGAVLAKLRAIGFAGPVGLQCFNLKGDPPQLLTDAMAAWRRLTAAREPAR
jgi:sugar phosphate isomerase/epimerase